MPNATDPYRNAIQRNLKEKEAKQRRKNFIEKNNHEDQKSKAFLDQSVELPESMNNVLGVGIFALLPYIIGITFIFLVIAQANIETYRNTEMNSFLLAWTIGYELIATVLLLFIFKSALTFKRR